MNKRYWAISFVLLVLLSCSKEVLESIENFPGFQRPSNFPEPVYNLANNTVTKDGFELGRKLFYEPRLSRNNTISCGSCHIQSSAFTQHGHDVSHGIDDRLGKRNSPAIMNLAWMPTYMWDGGVFDLDLQPIVPITAHEEMDENLENVLGKLRNLQDYPALYKKAFGSEEITTARTMKALSQFMVMCISANSKYDSVIRNQGVAFTTAEQEGFQLFKAKCASCHKEPFFSDFSFRNNGIPIGPNNDQGRFDITLNPIDRYKFKVPSLRNLQFTSPYMHDGRFYTLEAVLNHYTNGIEPTPNVDPLVSGGIVMTTEEKAKIIAFLKTLNDRSFINNKLLAEQ
jgi:cytochrome c peroxidase